MYGHRASGFDLKSPIPSVTQKWNTVWNDGNSLFDGVTFHTDDAKIKRTYKTARETRVYPL